VRDFPFRTNAAVASTSALPHPVPTLCPACRSSSIVTKVKEPDTDSYWRCTSCGEVWNDGRRQKTPPYGGHKWGW
jgi:predicted Zn finger-like uncharacterized protein